MNKSKLKRKGVSSTNVPYNKCTTNKKTLSFQHLCKEITRQQIDVLKLGKFVVKNLIAFKLKKDTNKIIYFRFNATTY